jgi:outer membrane receptor protein involved in Fe transport
MSTRNTTRWLARVLVRPSLVVALGLLLPATGRSAAAQTSTGNLRGYITSAGNAPVADATVTARLLENGQTRTSTTNSDGFYYLGGLRPGRYDVTVRRIGVAPLNRSVDVPIGVTVDLRLSVTEAAVQLSAVTVTATTATSAMTSEVGANIGRAQIANLPNYERNVLDLARLAPGITAQKVDNTDKTLSAGGQPAEAVNIFIDGASYKNDVLRGGVVGQDASKGNPFPQGAIQEFRVQTQNFKAEYQKAASAVITATTRTGGSRTEADFFAFGVGHGYTGRDAITTRNAGDAPKYKRLQAGGNIGGPIIPQKLFYFGTYELNFRDEPAYIRLGGDSLLAPAALRQQLLTYTGQQAQQFREHLGFGKVTWVATPKSTADFSINVRRDEDFRNFGNQTAFEAAENLRVNVYTGVANWKYAGDRYLNEAQVSAQSFTWNPTGSNFNLIGRDYRNILRIGGKDGEQNFKQGRIAFRDDITRGGVQLGGDHVFKVGSSLEFLSYDATKAQNGNPTFFYRVDELYARPFEAVFGFGNESIKTNNTQFGVYAQDDWTVTPRLTLNLGIRWDVETNMINNGYVTPQALADSLRGPLNSQLYVTQPLVSGSQQVRVADELGGIDRFISTGRSSRPIYKKAFQPRFGFSYDVTGSTRTIVFGGAGLYYDRNYWNTLLDEQFRRQYSVLRVAFQTTCGAGSPANCVVWDPKYFDPATLRTLSGSAGLPEVFMVANDLKPPRSLQMSFGVRQAVGDARLSVSYAGVRGSNYMNFVHAAPFNGLGPNYATLFLTDDRVKTWYDALQLQLDKPLRPDGRWGGGLAYTYGKAREQGQSTDLFWGFDDHFPTVADRPILATPGDQRHSVTANAIVRLPYEFLFSTITSLGSGVTANATDESNGTAYGTARTYTFTPTGTALFGFGPKFDTKNVDFRLEKALAVGGGQRVALLAEVFNALGNSNFGCYDARIAPTSGPPNANYGRPGCAGLGRRLQIGMRYGYHPEGTEQ